MKKYPAYYFPALLYKKEKNKTVRCQVCERRCLITPGKTGFCRARKNINGQLYALNYGLIVAAGNDPIEKKPVFHFYPGSLSFSIGTLGCNFRCRFCQNWDIAYTDTSQIENEELNPKTTDPQEIVQAALAGGAKSIAFTYNEPTIWLEYVLAVMKQAKKAQLFTVWVTNGYATKKTIDLIAPYLDVWRVDLKSFEDRFYQKLIGVPHAKPVFENTFYLKKKYPQIHIETVTNIVPGWNDNQENLQKIARFIAQKLGKKTPWHITRFFPAAQMKDTPPTPTETLFQAKKIGQKAGLKFIYLGNIDILEGENTYCPHCGALCIKRTGYQVEILKVDKKGRCSVCGTSLNIKIQ